MRVAELLRHLHKSLLPRLRHSQAGGESAREIPALRPPLGDSSADTYGVGRPAPPGRGREEHPGSPTPISCSLRGEPGSGGRKESQCQGALPQGSGPTRCSVASSGPRSLILGMAVGEEVGQWSPQPLAAPAWDLFPQPLGTLPPGPQHPRVLLGQGHGHTHLIPGRPPTPARVPPSHAALHLKDRDKRVRKRTGQKRTSLRA